MRDDCPENATQLDLAVAYSAAYACISVDMDQARGIESQIEDAVERAVERLLKPYLRRICDPEPATYTASQAATVLQVSEDIIGRMVRRGVLIRVPHVDGKLLIPARRSRHSSPASAAQVRLTSSERKLY
mgnify:CR=1 FL=1